MSNNIRKVGLGVLVVLVGTGITELPIVSALGYIVMLPGIFIFLKGFNGLLDAAEIGKKSVR